MDGRICIVTGANSGMGKVTSEALARRGATVVLLCRNRERGEAARREIVSETGNESVELVVADLSSQEQVRGAAAEIMDRHSRIHVLVNNAGVFLAERQLTEDGVEKTFATNYLGHFLLTMLLLDALGAGAPSRIVNVASRTGRYKIDLDDLALEKKYSTFSAASQSKLAQVMWTVELAQRLEGRSITANAVHPGLAKSGITRELPALMRVLLNLLSASPEKRAQTTIHVAAAPELADVSGQFFGPKRRPLKLPEQARSEQARRRLWDLSVKLANLEAAPSA
jgi:NAD(P)-dependent dehydrogenase (short-subunit alcohol dehydrogenase family)